MATTLSFPSAFDLPDLATFRESKGISLTQIADSTKIAIHYLEAIERSQFDQLPGGVFNTSYIRQYARAIDYDEWDLLASYSSQTQPAAPEPEPRRGLLRVFADWTRLFRTRCDGA